MHFLEKLCKILENIEILNLSKQKEEETIWSQNHIIALQISSEILLNKPVHLGLSILELSKTFNV